MRPSRIKFLASKLRELGTMRPAQVTWPGGVVSFTFDDFPKSALMTGGSILERHGSRGTYYTAFKLSGTAGVLGKMFDAEDIRTAYRTGHEIACHTFTHLDCAHATKSSIRAEVSSNAAALSTLTDGFMPTNFAYPYGSVSEVAKRVLGARFSSCRGVQPGINRETADLAELLANRIYAGHFDETHLRQLIDHAASASGWLIFYTHDVIDPPSPYGCTPEQLETIIAYAAQRTTILPVRDVVSRTAPSPPQRCTRGE